MSTANSYGDTAMPPNVSSALPSRSTASCERRSGKPARSWRWPILAVVLGLFAHQEALAQPPHNLTSLTVTAENPAGAGVTETTALSPEFPSTANAFTITFPFGATRVTVIATATGFADWTLTYLGDDDPGTAGYQGDLRSGANSIRVRATEDDGPGTRDYTITVRRAAETGSALMGLTLTGSATGGVTLDSPGFASGTDTRSFTADVALADATLTVDAEAKAGWTVTYDDEPDADGDPANGYQRNLAEAPQSNRIVVRATPVNASGVRNYTINVTRTTTPGAPRNLGATPFDQSVRLTWAVPSSDGGRDITGYEYRVKEDTDNGQWLNTEDNLWRVASGSTGSTEQHDVTSTFDNNRLVNGTTYIFQVRAANANTLGSRKGRASNTVEATPASRLEAPEWRDPATVPAHRRVTLQWTALTDQSVSGYEYQRSVGAGSYGGPSTIAARDLVVSGSNDENLAYTVTGLTNGTEYRFRVRGRNSRGDGAWSEERSATPEARPPGAPTNLRATAGDGQVALSWTAPSDSGGEPITRYEYQVDSDPLTADDTWVATGGGTRTTVTVHTLPDVARTGLVNGTTYYFRVRAVNDSGCSDSETAGCGHASLEVSATPFGRPETTIDRLTAMHGDRRVKLGWTILTDEGDYDGFQYRQKAGGGYGNWTDVRNSGVSIREHVVAGLTNGTTYTFEVRAVNGSGGGLASDEASAVPSTTPSAPRLTATAGDEEVRLRWIPAANGGSRITGYEYQMTTGATDYSGTPERLGASATTHTLTDADSIVNDTTYRFQVRAVNVNGPGDWSNEVSARPTDISGARSFTISATIDGKSWAKAGGPYPLHATVEVNPRFTAQSTMLWVGVSGSGLRASEEPVTFGPTDSRRDASFDVNPTYSVSSPYITVALLPASDNDPTVVNNDLATALAVTSVEVRPADTPDPPMGLVATRGDGEVTLSWATPTPRDPDLVPDDYEYRQRRQPGPYGRWTDFAGGEFQRPGTGRAVTSNTVTGLTNGGTYGFQVRGVDVDTTTTPDTRSPGDPSDEVTVSLSGTVETGGLSAPRNLAAAAGNGQVTLSWDAPASDGGAAISGYQYQRRAGAGAYGQWTTIPGGSLARAHTVTGLANGTRYFFRVRAVNSDGPGPGSTEESATPSLGVDTTLRTLSLSTVALAPITLTPAFTPATRTYTATVGGSVTQVTVAATANKTGLPPPTITPADASTAVAGHQVALVVGSNAIRVRVTDGTNTGDYTITVTRAARVPAAPTGLTATAGGGTVTLSWTAPTGGGAVSRYEYRQKTGTGAYGAWTPIPGSGPSTTSHTVTGLTNGTAYAFRVRAVNSVGNGAASNEATATPALVRLVWAKTEREVADTITAARNAGYGDDMTFTAGETVVVRGSALFNAAEGVSLTFTTTSDDTDAASAAASDGTVTVTARAAGMATITITAQASRPSGVTIVEQTDPREASITFPVEVGLEALTLELSGPSDGTNLVEGGRRHPNGTVGTVTVRVTANRPVTEDVTVTLLPDRALSDATATTDDFAADPIVIEAGETTGSTVVTAVEDETAEGMEELVLFGVAAGNAGAVTGEVRLRLWDAAVPALPIIAQLLLAAFLAIGGYRRYRRR